MAAIRWLSVFGALFMAAIAGAASAPAQGAVPGPADTAPPRHVLETGDLHAWLDGMLPYALQSGDIAGVVIAIVKDGEILVEQGYGYADAAKHLPMDPECTLIRAGSTSKLFTWTAVMQLVAAGKIDLHRDINDYLDFRVPTSFGRPVTMLDLMNHRGGFEEGLKDVLILDPKLLPSTEASLKGHPRPQLFAPGTVPAYSNYGAGLAGYIVERVSGERFEQYIERHIFRPLGMEHSSFEQPFPAAFEAALSKGYRTPDLPPQPVEFIATRPAGSLATTVSDLTRFMRAHLAGGSFGGAEILDRATTQTMHEPSQDAPPGFATMAHGFFHETRNGRTMIGHGGDTVVFHTEFDLLPEENVGITFTFNSRGRDDSVYAARKALVDEFMNRYFPAKSQVQEVEAIASAADDARRIAGRYESSRRIVHGFLSVFYLLQQTTIAMNPDGTIVMPREAGPGDAVFREIDKDLWQEVGGNRRVALREVDGIRTVIDSTDPSSVLQAVPIRRNSVLNMTALAGSLVVLLAVVAWWPASAMLRRHYRASAEDPMIQSLRRRVRWIAAGNLIYCCAWMWVLAPVVKLELEFYSSRLDPLIRTLQVGGVAVVIANAFGVLSLWQLGRLKSGWSGWLRAGLMAAAFAGIVWIGLIGQLIGFNLDY